MLLIRGSRSNVHVCRVVVFLLSGFLLLANLWHVLVTHERSGLFPEPDLATSFQEPEPLQS